MTTAERERRIEAALDSIHARYLAGPEVADAVGALYDAGLLLPPSGERTFGYAVCDRSGGILVQTVSPTPRAAQVNWMVAALGMLAQNDWPDEMIADAFARLSGRLQHRLVRVAISETPQEPARSPESDG